PPEQGDERPPRPSSSRRLPASARPRGDTGAHTPERKDSRRALPDRARFRPRRSSRLSPTPVLNESDRLRLSRAMPPCTAPRHLVAAFLSRVFAAIDPLILCNAVTAVNAGNQVDASLAVLRTRGVHEIVPLKKRKRRCATPARCLSRRNSPSRGNLDSECSTSGRVMTLLRNRAMDDRRSACLYSRRPSSVGRLPRCCCNHDTIEYFFSV